MPIELVLVSVKVASWRSRLKPLLNNEGAATELRSNNYSGRV
ncbi:MULTISPECIES: hypothetical protein [Chroococcidiopsis]|nr:MULTISPECIES: hypothetical protein [Chroococcidiopsis]